MPDDPRRTAQSLTESDLLQAAVITERDKAEGIAFWKAHGSPLTNALLDAKPVTDGQ